MLCPRRALLPPSALNGLPVPPARGTAVPMSSRPHRAPPEPGIRGESMGTAIGPEGWRTGLLAELYNRTQLAQGQLGNLVNGQKKYLYEVSEAIIDVFDLPADKADILRDFAEKAVNLLDKSHQQALTWFLGDGKMNRERLKYSINGNEDRNLKS